MSFNQLLKRKIINIGIAPSRKLLTFLYILEIGKFFKDNEIKLKLKDRQSLYNYLSLKIMLLITLNLVYIKVQQ